MCIHRHKGVGTHSDTASKKCSLLRVALWHLARKNVITTAIDVIVCDCELNAWLLCVTIVNAEHLMHYHRFTVNDMAATKWSPYNKLQK